MPNLLSKKIEKRGRDHFYYEMFGSRVILSTYRINLFNQFEIDTHLHDFIGLVLYKVNGLPNR